MDITALSSGYDIGSFTKPATTRPSPNADLAKIQRFAKDYEAFTLGVMFEQMYSGLKAEAPFGGGNAEITFRSMLIHAQAQQFSDNGGVGMAKDIENQLLKTYTKNK